MFTWCDYTLKSNSISQKKNQWFVNPLRAVHGYITMYDEQIQLYEM